MTWQRWLKDWQMLTPAGRMLVFNGFSFNLGFYMLLPYLANHLQSLGYSSGYIGLIIGLRVLSQQGLFLVGGTLGDRFGYKLLILIGCAVRILGFLLLAVGSHFAAIVLGAFFTGFAGALFTPSSQAYLSAEYLDDRERNRVFALQNLATEAGMLIGPLLGLGMLSLSFASLGISAASLFGLLLVLQWRYLPKNAQSPQAHTGQPFWLDWWQMLLNKPFVSFVLAASAYQVLFHQLYLSIPHQVQHQTGDPSVITSLFIVSSLMGVLLQVPISHWVERTLGIAKAMAAGMTIMGSAFLALNVAFPPWPALPFILCAILLSLGSMMVFPLLGAFVPRFAQPTKLASYYGLYSCIGGFLAFIGNWLSGWLLGHPYFPPSWLWLGLALLGGLSGLSLYLQVSRRGRPAMEMAR